MEIYAPFAKNAHDVAACHKNAQFKVRKNGEISIAVVNAVIEITLFENDTAAIVMEP